MPDQVRHDELKVVESGFHFASLCSSPGAMSGLCYIADPGGAVRKVELGELTALFHLPSGMTHILAPPAPQILEVLAGEPGDAGEILARIGARFEVESGAEAAAAIEARLAELEAAGLVRRA